MGTGPTRAAWGDVVVVLITDLAMMSGCEAVAGGCLVMLVAACTSGACLSPPDLRSVPQAVGRGEPCAALRNHRYLDAHHGQPRPSSHQPNYTLTGPTPSPRCRDRRRTRHRPKA